MSPLRAVLAAWCLGLALLAQVTVSPAAFSTQYLNNPTGLGWMNNGSGTPYAGTILTASGGTGITSSHPYQWSLQINGLTVQTCATSRCATPLWQHTVAQTHAGQLDADGDTTGTNTTVVYLAPDDFPSNQQVKICATDGSTTGCATATIPYGAFPPSWATHRARLMGMDNFPWTMLSNGASPVPTYQSGLVYFPDPFDQGWMAIASLSPGGITFPTTAGSEINRPAWSYNGKLFAYNDAACVITNFCPSTGTAVDWIGPSGLRANFGDGIPGFATYTWDYHRPTWMLVENWTDPATTVSILDLDANSSTQTTVFSVLASRQACGSDYCQPTLRSQMGGTDNSRNFLMESNYFPGGSAQCYPAGSDANCAIPGGGPNLWSFDLAGCEASLSTGCGTQVAEWNIDLGLGSYLSGTGTDCENGLSSWPSTSAHYDANGHPHQVFCEFGVHDIYYRRGANQIIWNFGPHGSVGEPLFFMANDDGTGVRQLYPNQTATVNYPYWGHPAFNSTGNLVTYDGTEYCAPSGNSCSSGSHYGIGFTNLARPQNCPASPADFPSALNPNCGVVRFMSNLGQGTAYGHGAWDGFDNNHVGHDAAFVIGGLNQQQLYESAWNEAQGNTDTTITGGERLLFDFGGNGGSTSGLFSPTQSPDATKLAYSFPLSDSALASPVPYWFWTRTPVAPANVNLGSATAAQIQWSPAALSHEAQQFWVWKQPSCAGAWSRLASIAAVYLQANPYSYTDSTLASGSSACYGVTAVEWSGSESEFLSNQIGVTNTAGSVSVTSRRPSGTVNFDSTSPGAVTGFTAAAKALCASGCAAVGQPSSIRNISVNAQVSTTLTNAVFGSTTSTTSVAAAGSATITVGTTAGLQANQVVLFDVGVNQEALAISSLTPTTITATFTKTHAQPFTVASLPQQVAIGNGVNAVQGEPLTIDSGSSQETVIAQLVGSTYLIATFTKNHAAGATVTAGALPTGTYNVKLTYCKYTDFPRNTTCTETLPSAVSSVSVSSANSTIAIQPSTNEMVGQDAVCAYVNGPSDSVGTYHLDGCTHLPDYANITGIQTSPGGTQTTGGLGSFIQPDPATNFIQYNGGTVQLFIESHNGAGAAPPSSNTTLAGYSLAWTLPSDQDLRYVLVLYSEGAAPSASNPWPFEIAAAPGTATSFYDGYPNQAPNGHIFYALETLDSEGKLGGCVGYDATAGITASCRP